MRAAVHDVYGPPGVLRVAEVPRPDPEGDEVLVRVHASTVNRSDCGFRAAEPPIARLFTGLRVPKRKILGTEFSGEVVAVGPDVTGFKVGDEVFGRTPDTRMGANAEYLCIGQDEPIGLKPDGLTHIEAAAICDGAMLAKMYLDLVDLERHPRLLINGASGAIGAAAVQLAKARGAEVTAVCKSEAVDIVRALGAERVIDYRKEDFTQSGAVYDTVFDAVGKTSLGACRHFLAEGGTFFATDLGPRWENPIMALRTALIGGAIKVYFPIPRYRKADVLYFRELVEAGKFHSVIDRTYPLDRIVEATEYVERGEKIGNVVITVVGDSA